MAVVNYINRPALNKLITCSQQPNCLLDANETENLNEKLSVNFTMNSRVLKLSASLNKFNMRATLLALFSKAPF